MLRFPFFLLLFAALVFLAWIALRRRFGLRRPPGHLTEVPTSGQEARGAPRFPVLWPVAIGTRSGIRQGVTRNVSRGGVFVQMDPPLELGKTYAMSIGISDDKTIQVQARVVWSISGGSSKQDLYGMGVMFTSISEEDLALVGALDLSSEEFAA